MGGSSPSPAPQSSTVTQVQQIPQYQQDFAQQNMNLAQSLGAQPYPTYNAPIIAGLNDTENAGLGSAIGNAYNFETGLGQGMNELTGAEQQNPTAAGDPSQNGYYGSTAVANENLVPGTASVVDGNIGQAEAYSNIGAATATGANTYGTAASGMATAAANNNMTGAVSGQVNNLTGTAAGMNPVAGTTAAVNALDPGNAGVIQRYMNPYVQASLQPQLLQAGILQSQQQNQINSQATGANAFGDARQGTQNALQNYYGQQTNAGIEATGYNTAYNVALNTAMGEQTQQQNLGTLGVNEQNALNNLAGTQVSLGNMGVAEQNAQTNAANTVLGAGSLQNQTANTVLNAAGVNVNAANAATNLANTGVNEQNVMLNQQTAEQNYQKLLQAQQAQTAQMGMDSAQLGQQDQTDTLNAANAQYDAGNIEQQNQQSQLTAAYQQYMNQVNWPYQMLNVQESALSNTPYQIANATTVPTPNSTTSNLAAFTSLAGALGSTAAKTS